MPTSSQVNPPHRPRRKVTPMILSVLILIATLLGLLEVSIAVGLLPDVTQQAANQLDDPYLGSRYLPGSADHDANGWRNAAVPADTSVVCIGDSQTYGLGVARDDAYPQQLSSLLNAPVYNMARGGYGPVEYAYLIDEALTLQPDVLVIGIYMGNDVADCFRAATRPAWTDLLAADYDLEANPLTASIRLWNMELATRSGDIEAAATAAADLEQPVSAAPIPAEAGDEAAQPAGFTLRSLAFLRAILFPPAGRADEQARYDQQLTYIQDFAAATGLSGYYVAYADEQVATHFSPAYRDATLDRSEPAIAEGYRICANRLAAIQQACDEAGVQCLFVTIPTKERVFAPYLAAQGVALSAPFADLVQHENEVRADLSALLDGISAAYLDVTPALEAAVLPAADGQAIYRRDHDGHPAGAGYRVIAEAIAADISARGWLDD